MGWTRRRLALAFIGASLLFFFGLYGRRQPTPLVPSSGQETKDGHDASSKSNLNVNSHFPHELVGVVYKENDFENKEGIVPAYWGCEGDSCQEDKVWGPCFPTLEKVDWNETVEYYLSHPVRYMRMGEGRSNTNNLADLCRPGFLIIGAGKCGTSSLYHYLTDHPKVLPAKEKQIHYFKYYTRNSLQWYLKHFPTATSFLAKGALMSGEASPGYLPYPEVAALVRQRLPGPRIITVGREPIDRAWSSYRYNYANPLLEKLRSGGKRGIPKGQPDEAYEEYLFSFEDLVRAEIKVLRECFAENGPGVVGARRKHGKRKWFKQEMERRANEGEPPLVDLDDFCYGSTVSATVPRKQWADLVAQYPDKIINVPNLHLVQSLIGRGLYTFPLEWWYAAFPREQLYFVCTEELGDLSGGPLNELGTFLGLPEHNFSTSVMKGAYNVGGHRGYDKEVSWSTIEKDSRPNETNKEIPLSVALRKEVEDFVRPLNERLFSLTGRRCSW